MARATYGLLVGMVGSVIGFWIWSRQSTGGTTDSRGTVIYRNTPTASGGR